MKLIIFCQEEETKKTIIDSLILNYEFLVNNSNGYQAIQEGIEVNYSLNIKKKFDVPLLRELFYKFKGNLVRLSMLKYPSKVIKKCLLSGDDFVLQIFFEEICKHNFQILGKYK